MTGSAVPAATQRQVRPLTAVLQAFAEGASSLDEISLRTALARDVVQASVEHLTRMGRIEAKELSMGCPSGGCGGCASGHADGSSGCGADGPSVDRRGPVLVQLSLRRPGD